MGFSREEKLEWRVMLVLSPQQEDPAVGMHTLSQFIAHGLLQPAEPGGLTHVQPSGFERGRADRGIG